MNMQASDSKTRRRGHPGTKSHSDSRGKKRLRRSKNRPRRRNNSDGHSEQESDSEDESSNDSLAEESNSRENQQQTNNSNSRDKIDLRWPDLSGIPKNASKLYVYKRNFREDPVQYIELLKFLREKYPQGNIGVVSEEAAKEIALAMNFSNCKEANIQQTIKFLSENIPLNFNKLNEDIHLIEQGKEEDILPIENAQMFKDKKILIEIFESITQPGTKIKKCTDYERDIKLVFSQAMRMKLYVLYVKKLLLSCQAVLYKRFKFKSDEEQNFTLELKAYNRLHRNLVMKSQSPPEIQIRRARKSLILEYNFKKMYDESFEPTTDFERRVLGEFSSDPEAKKSSKEKNSGGAANIVESQKEGTERGQKQLKRRKKRFRCCKSSDSDDDDWEPSSRKVKRTDDIERKGRASGSQKQRGAVDKATTSKSTSTVTRTQSEIHQKEHGKRIKKEPDERCAVKVEEIVISDSEEEQQPTVEATGSSSKNLQKENQPKKEPEDTNPSKVAEIIVLSSDSEEEHEPTVEVSETNGQDSRETAAIPNETAGSMCIVCKKKEAVISNKYCSEGCIRFSLCVDANKEKISGNDHSEKGSIGSDAATGTNPKDSTKKLVSTKDTGVMENEVEKSKVVTSDGSNSFKVVIGKNDLDGSINIKIVLENHSQKHNF